ncbi:MAG: hypothetical protein PHC51_05500 [bacterium]|nr:hypothetical protein [bacterium]
MWLERLELFSAPGFERGGLGLKVFSPYINIIHGPNSSGKSTLLRSILHSSKPGKEMYLAQVSWVTSQGTIFFDVKGSRRKFADTAQETIFSGVISSSVNPLEYFLSVDFLATASLESGDVFVATLLKELRGGIDITVLTSGGLLDVHPRRLQSLAKKVRDAERELKKIDNQYELLAHQEEALTRLEAQQRDIEQRLRNCALENRLDEIRELFVRLQELEGWIQQQPEVIKHHSPQTFKRLIELEEEIPLRRSQIEILLERSARLDEASQKAIFSDPASVVMIDTMLDVWRNYRDGVSEIENLQNYLLSSAERIRVIEKYFFPLESGEGSDSSVSYPASSELDKLDELFERLETERNGLDTLRREYELYRSEPDETVSTSVFHEESLAALRLGEVYQFVQTLRENVLRLRNMVLLPVLAVCGVLLFYSLYVGEGDSFRLGIVHFVPVSLSCGIFLILIAIYILGVLFSKNVVSRWQGELIDECRRLIVGFVEKTTKAGREARVRQLKAGIEFHQNNIAGLNESIASLLSKLGCSLPKGNIQRVLIVALLRERFVLLAEDAERKARLQQLQKQHHDNRLALFELLGRILKFTPQSISDGELVALVSRVKEDFPSFQNLRLENAKVEQQLDVLQSGLASLMDQQESFGVTIDLYRLHFGVLEEVESTYQLYLSRQSECLKLKQKLLAIEEETARHYHIDEELLRRKLSEPAVNGVADEVVDLESKKNELVKQIADIHFAIRAARASHQRENSQIVYQQTMRDYSKELKKSAHAIAAQFILQRVEKDYQRKYSPELLQRAAEMFSRFTNGAMEMRLSPSSGGSSVVEFWDSVRNQCLRLEQLSRGTRTQALLAARLAYLFVGEKGESLPVLLDEALSASDSVRYSEIASMLQALATDGRQIFYCTCRDEEASFWRYLAETSPGKILVHDLASS